MHIEETEHPVVEAVAELVEDRLEGQENANAIIAEVTENAQERIDEAHEAAQAVVEGAMLTALGQRFETLSQEIGSWQTERDALLQTVASLELTVAGLVTRMVALEMAPQAVLSLSNPTQSPEATITLPVETLAPENLPSVVEENREAQTEQPEKQKRRRWT